MSFLQELNDAVARGSPESRLKALWHATDTLLAGHFTEDQIWIFGEVIGRLAQELETAARTQLAKRLASSDMAPIYMINKLAFDDSIEVAGPVLRHSERLDVQALVANARTKSQEHLFAISQRKSIAELVTDVLITRGNRRVAHSVVANLGALLSKTGILHLVKRSESDFILTEQLGLRKDIPRQVFHQLIAKAAEDVSKKLQNEQPGVRDEIRTVVTDVTGALHSKFGPASEGYFAAKRAVGRQHKSGGLGEMQILEYAQARKFYEVTVALSLLCSLPVDAVERALVDESKEVILVLAKALDLSWTTTMSMLFLGAPDYRIVAGDLDSMKAEFTRLNVEISKKVLQIYWSRRARTAASSEFRRLPQLHAL